jgi:hypothetical protein
LLAANVVWEQLLVTSSSRYAGRGGATGDFRR